VPSSCTSERTLIQFKEFEKGEVMRNYLVALATMISLIASSSMKVNADDPQKTLIVTMTNDPTSNAVIVIDAATHTRLQTLSTNGKGGVGGNAGGVKEYGGKLVAAVNNGSGTVAVFRRAGNGLILEQSVATTSSPVSVDFANNHMYVAGAASVDSFILNGDHVGALDGTTGLVLVGGGLPPNGSTAQVGDVNDKTLLVTLKTDPIPGTVDVVELKDGAISGFPTAVSAPAGTLTPFGFSVYPDGTAIITLAHSGNDGLFRNGTFASVIPDGGQAGDCWTTRVGKYVFTVNTGSRTISRLIGTGSNIFIDNAVAATISGGSPTDTDANGGYLAVIDHQGGSAATSHLNLFTYNSFGELSVAGSALDLGVASANGVSVLQPNQDEE
jgi:hypothetical protein